jgi:excisionase family DNA binding protein
MSGELLTFKDAKEYLRVSSSTLYRLVQRKDVPASKIGRSWRFRKERLIIWLEEQEKKGQRREDGTKEG